MVATKKDAELTPPRYKYVGANMNQKNMIRRMEQSGHTVQETSDAMSMAPEVVCAFREDKGQSAKPEPTKKKSLWCRYIKRLEKATGGKPIKCH